MGKKWDPDAKPAEKMLALYSMLLFTGREASLSELSRNLNCSKATVKRLIAQLESSRFGKVHSFFRGREIVYRIERPGTPPRISLSAEGLRQLALCRDFILHLLPEGMRKTLDATLQQALAYTDGEGTGEQGDGMGRSFVRGRINYTPYQGMLQTLMRAIEKRQVCEVQYQSWRNKEARTFEYAPKRLIAFHESIHVSGWIVTEKGRAMPKREEPSTLALQRFRDVVLTRRKTDHLPEPTEENQGAFGLMEDDPFMARVRFSEKVAAYVSEREWSREQRITWHKNGSLTLRLEVRSPAEFISWVLSFGREAEVLSPKWVREELKNQFHHLTDRYSL